MTISGVELLPGGAWKVGGFTLTPNSPWDLSTLGGVEIQKEEGEGKEIRIRDGNRVVCVKFLEGSWRMRSENAPVLSPSSQGEREQISQLAESDPRVTQVNNYRLPLIAASIVTVIVMFSVGIIIWHKFKPEKTPSSSTSNNDQIQSKNKDTSSPSAKQDQDSPSLTNEANTVENSQKPPFFIPDKPIEPDWQAIDELNSSGLRKWVSNRDVWEMNHVFSSLLLFPNGDFRLSSSGDRQDFSQSQGVEFFLDKSLNSSPRIRIFKSPGIGKEMEIDQNFGIEKDPWAVDSGSQFKLRYYDGAWQMKKVIRAFTPPPPALPGEAGTVEWAKIEDVMEENGRFYAQRAKFHRFPFKKSPADPTKYEEEEGGMGYTLYPNGDINWQADISQGFGFPDIKKYSKGTIRYEGGHWQVKRHDGSEPLVEYTKPQTKSAAPERISKGEVAKWEKVVTPLKISETLELLPSGEMRISGVIQPQEAEVEFASSPLAKPRWNYQKSAGAGKKLRIDQWPGQLQDYQFDPVLGWLMLKQASTQGSQNEGAKK